MYVKCVNIAHIILIVVLLNASGVGGYTKYCVFFFNLFCRCVKELTHYFFILVMSEANIVVCNGHVFQLYLKNGTENYININKVTLYHDYKKGIF